MVDNNENKYWDEADFSNETFAEDAYVFYKKAVVRPLWETRENWDLKDTRTLDNPKGNSSSTAPTGLSANQDESVKTEVETKKEIKSDNAIITPVK